MGYKALLTLDLDNSIASEDREKFYECLETKKWKKLSTLSTAWKTSFDDDLSRDAAIRSTKNDLKEARKMSGVSAYNAAIQVGKGFVEEF